MLLDNFLNFQNRKLPHSIFPRDLCVQGVPFGAIDLFMFGIYFPLHSHVSCLWESPVNICTNHNESKEGPWQLAAMRLFFSSEPINNQRAFRDLWFIRLLLLLTRFCKEISPCRVLINGNDHERITKQIAKLSHAMTVLFYQLIIKDEPAKPRRNQMRPFSESKDTFLLSTYQSNQRILWGWRKRSNVVKGCLI